MSFKVVVTDDQGRTAVINQAQLNLLPALLRFTPRKKKTRRRNHRRVHQARLSDRLREAGRKMKITADELYALLDASPANKQASGAGMMRNGRVVRCVSSFDIEALASKLNEHFGAKTHA